ncbi:MAG: DUF1513 domain-containing protein [Pseudomonadota bacterium]
METELYSRRSFLASSTAAGLMPTLTWADAGAPHYLSAARMPDGSHRLFGLDSHVQPVFSVPLPERGHAAALHPDRPEAVAFARRPGTFALIGDCARGLQIATLAAPAERHFYGHGAFSADGRRLFTTENAYEIGEGRIGIWAADQGYRRTGEFYSGGVGPHDMVRLPGTNILAVANGGIDTHPETGREKLNLPTMQPNLTYVTTAGELLEQVTLSPAMRLNSIRHLAVRSDALVAFGCQWQGDLRAAPSLLGTHRLGGGVRFAEHPAEDHARLEGYVGSVAFSGDGSTLCISAPRGDAAQLFDVSSMSFVAKITSQDICGIAQGPTDFVATTGFGYAGDLHKLDAFEPQNLAWDNHLVKRR